MAQIIGSLFTLPLDRQDLQIKAVCSKYDIQILLLQERLSFIHQIGFVRRRRKGHSGKCRDVISDLRGNHEKVIDDGNRDSNVLFVERVEREFI